YQKADLELAKSYKVSLGDKWEDIKKKYNYVSTINPKLKEKTKLEEFLSVYTKNLEDKKAEELKLDTHSGKQTPSSISENDYPDTEGLTTLEAVNAILKGSPDVTGSTLSQESPDINALNEKILE